MKQKKKEGIFEFNLNLIADDKDPEMRERKPKHDDQLRICEECKGFFSNKYFFKHKCITETPKSLKPKLLQKTSTDKMDADEGFRDILNRFRDGEIGYLCRSNKTLKLIGYRHFNLRRHEDGKQDEVRKVVMAEMRELGKLFLTFQNLTSTDNIVEDMLKRENLNELVEAANS